MLPTPFQAYNKPLQSQKTMISQPVEAKNRDGATFKLSGETAETKLAIMVLVDTSWRKGPQNLQESLKSINLVQCCLEEQIQTIVEEVQQANPLKEIRKLQDSFASREIKSYNAQLIRRTNILPRLGLTEDQWRYTSSYRPQVTIEPLDGNTGYQISIESNPVNYRVRTVHQQIDQAVIKQLQEGYA